MKELQITANESGQRLDKYLKKLLPNAQANFIYKMLRKKNITLNGKKAEGSMQLSCGDCVTLYLSDETYGKFSQLDRTSIAPPSQSRPMPSLDILYEDKDILVINKPSGMLSQKAAASDISANEIIIQYLLDSGAVTQQGLRAFRPSVCNRLDRNTSGILIAGKTLHGLQQISRQLKDRSIQKYYRCITAGTVTEPQRLKALLEKDARENKSEIYKLGTPGQIRQARKGTKIIETECRPICHYGNCTLMEVHLITGRSHQIRAHLASIGHPVIGDAKYGDEQLNQKLRLAINLRHQLLHAYRIVLADGKEIVAPLPEIFAQAEAFLRQPAGK